MENESTQRGLPKAEGMECQARCQWRAEAESRCWPCRRLEAASTGLEAGSLGRGEGGINRTFSVSSEETAPLTPDGTCFRKTDGPTGARTLEGLGEPVCILSPGTRNERSGKTGQPQAGASAGTSVFPTTPGPAPPRGLL